MSEILKIIAVTGPTATGKTALAVALARRFDAEIVSVDSRQVYRHMDIGTGKDLAEYGDVKYHLIDIADPATEVYDLAHFCRDASRAVLDIAARGKSPILAGGTGLYLRSLLYGLDDLPNDPELRATLDAEYDSAAGEAVLHDRMRELDPAAFAKFETCRRRLIRALEVRLITGKSLLELQGVVKPLLRYEVEAWRLDPPTEVLK